MTDDTKAVSPAEARARFRSGLIVPTAGWSDGFTQANLIAVPADYAEDLLEFARRNPQSCPVIDVLEAGQHASALAPDSDIRTDLPLYRVWRDGVLTETVADATAVWRDDLVTLLIGCSFTFEAALAEAGVPLRHIELGRNVPMYLTDIDSVPAGRIGGRMVVSMRPMPAELVAVATAVTAKVPLVHGAPVHAGDPAAIGITDIGRPDFGDAVPIHPGEVPVFWACGVTPQSAVMASKPPFAISHAPGHMFISDVPESRYRTGD